MAKEDCLFCPLFIGRWEDLRLRVWADEPVRVVHEVAKEGEEWD